MIIAHKIELKPNNKQISYFTQAVGTARFAYNWALKQWQLQYQAYQLNNTLSKPSQFSLRKELNAIKNTHNHGWTRSLNVRHKWQLFN